MRFGIDGIMKHANISIFVPHKGCPNNCSFCNQKAISGQIEPATEKDVITAVNTAISHKCAVPFDRRKVFIGHVRI